MLNAIVVSIRFILLIVCGHKQVALENAALRQQLAVYKRSVPRPKLNNRDRLFWICLRIIWRPWKVRLNDREAGNRNILASRSVQTVLVEVVASETTGSPADWFGDPKADPHDGNRQPDMGSTSHPRGIEKTGIHDLRTNGVALDA